MVPPDSPSAPAEPAPAVGRRSVLRVLGGYALEVLALASLALAQPLLNLFGANPEFFVASDSSSLDIVLFALVVVLAVPMGAIAVEALVLAIGGPRAGQVAHGVVLGVLAFALGLALGRQLGLDATLAALALAAAVTAVVVALRFRVAAFRSMLHYLALLPVGVLVLFLFSSESGQLIWQGEAEAADAVTVGRDAPVVFVMFDELPISSLLRADGTLNEDRFPNFARLGEQATWYRNATSLAGSTVRSVPSALTGLDPVDAPTAPISAELPRNLFTLLGGAYEMDVFESITNLCPSTLCATDDGLGIAAQLRRSLADAGVVYGHQVLPEDWSDGLPAVDQSWEGFIDEAEPAQFEGESDDLGPDFEYVDPGSFISLMRQRNPEAFDGLKGEPLLRSVEEATFGPGRLYFAHESFPHAIWERTPEGGVYAGDPGPPGAVDGRWTQDSFLVRQGLQRHLLQVGYADTVLGELIDRLEAAGVWEDALVVVTADHGIAFRPGSPTRQPTEMNLQEIYRVPLFVKAPGQTEGTPDDRNALLTDILPTIVDLLDVEVDWTFDGRSLVGPPRRDDRKPVVYSGPAEVPGGFDEAVVVAGRNSLLLPFDGSWPALARVGPDARLIGREARALGVTGRAPLSWTLDEADVLAEYDPGADLLPVVVHGRARATAGDLPTTALVAINGRLAGAVGFTDAGPASRFTALIDHRLVAAGANRVQLFVVDQAGSTVSLREAIGST